MSQPVEIRRGTETFRGPDLAQVVAWAREGRVVATDFILDPVSGSWLPASDHPEVGPALVAPRAAAPVKSGRGRMVGCLLLVFVAFAFCIALVWFTNDASTSLKKLDKVKASRPQQFQPAVGQEARLTVSSGVVVVCRAKEGMKELTKLSVANDTLGIAEMMLRGRAFGVESGTKVLIIDNGFDVRQVRILEGQMLGRSGWVNRVFLAPL